MYFFVFLSSPKPGSEADDQYGGAYISCWINSNKHAEAEAIARQQIEKFGWNVEGKEADRTISAEDYGDSRDDLKHFRDAQKQGSCFVFHTWPAFES
jgi:hypothetical protein